jgi:plastocyanin
LIVRRFVSAAGVVVLASLGMLVPSARADAEQTVQVSAITGYSPSSVTVATGTTVVWKNTDAFDYPGLRGTHQIAFDDGSFTSPLIGPNGSFAMRFLKPGTFAYHCTVHPVTMKGSVAATGAEVKPPAAEKDVSITEDNPTNPPSWGFKPADLTVETGTTITWRNTGGQAHTVTADDSSFDSGSLAAGATFKRTFDKPGVFRYHCSPHSWMTGVVRVAAPGAAPPTEQPRPATARSSGSAAAGRPQAALTGGPARIDARIVEPDPAQPLQWGFDPASLKARVGDTVVWRNDGDQKHTVTADDGSFDSGMLAPGASFTRLLQATGVVRYHCTPHPWMKGVISIGTAAAPAVDVAAPASEGVVGTPASAVSGSGSGDDASAAPPASFRASRDRGIDPAQIALVAIAGLLFPGLFLFATGWRPRYHMELSIDEPFGSDATPELPEITDYQLPDERELVGAGRVSPR